MHRLTAPTNPNTAPTKTGEVQQHADACGLPLNDQQNRELVLSQFLSLLILRLRNGF